MRPPRFYWSDMGLILETAIPLSLRQRRAVADYAEKEYRRRLRGLSSGDRRDAIVRVIEALRADNFVERPIPAHDYEKEAIIHG